MIEVRLSPAARIDLEGIRQYSLDTFDPAVADSYFLGFDAAFDLLSNHPRVGATAPELGKDIRCLVHRSHRLFYRIDKKMVLIVRIVHHAQDARSALGKAI